MFLRFDVAPYLLAPFLLDPIAAVCRSVCLWLRRARHCVVVAVYPGVDVGKVHKKQPAPVEARRLPFLIVRVYHVAYFRVDRGVILKG